MPQKVYARVFKFKGGHLALNFTNTVHWHKAPQPIELIATYADLLTWGQKAGVVAPRVAARLLAQASQHPKEAETVRRGAIVLREALYRMFTASIAGRKPEAVDVAALNTALTGALPHLQMAHTAKGYEWQWADEAGALECVVWPVARAAAALLASEQLARVGQCADERGCGWLFLDTTKNGRRRWCAMNDCGSINKARRYYRRKLKRGQRR